MSGGRLVVLDALGRAGKHYPLPKGLVTLGSDRTLCDILLLVPSVSSHHATIQVHANQTVVHNMSEKRTLVNGQPVSVAALQHGDVISVGNRRFRWEYDDATAERPLAAEPALCAVARRRTPRRRARSAHARLSAAARPRLALHLAQRASMPAQATASAKQVAIVQPQRREETRRKVPKSDGEAESMTKATLWIESRKSGPRKSARESAPTPLRTALLKRSLPAKIQAPLKLDHTKQVAINLMTGHVPKSRLGTKAKSPLLVVKKHGPNKRTTSKRSSSARNSSVRVVEINETDPGQSFTSLGSSCTLSPPSLSLQTPRKSALKDPKVNKSIKKNESIKFDLSNLEKQDNEDALSEKSDNLSLRLSLDSPSSSPSKVPSPRPPLRRSRQILELSLGKTIDVPECEGSPAKPPTPPTPPGRKSSRGSLMLQKCLDRSMSSEASEYTIGDLTSHYSSLGSRESFSLASKKISARSTDSKSLTTPENSEEIQKRISLNSTKISRASKSRSRINDIESGKLSMSCFSDDGDSPRTSRRGNKSNQYSFVTANVSGTVTPENEVEPEEASTPVLNIQNLLNSTSFQRSPKVRANLKRKTIGVLSAPRATRAGAKWKSLDGTSGRNVEEKASTPKRRGHLSPETVKEKHSTAKKSKSRRSIIDDLGKSDISKQLFNSPVKRKLSHSMTEFSKSLLLDEDDVSFGNTEAYTYTPDRFVSPLNSPTGSPNISGVKRLFRKNSPENDLRDLRGVKALLRTPRAKKGGDDLTDVSGVKLLFNKSPRNRLSDVRVKSLWAGLAENDLRRVSGVKRILRTDTPNNDLRNVSGVKRMLRTNSPKNDLGDVSGVGLLFGREKRNSLNEMSGVEQLLNDSGESHKDTSNAEVLFDRLIGKPPIKATYSKSFCDKLSRKSHQTRKAKSFHDPVNILPDNVDEWLEDELKKRVDKDSSAKKRAPSRKKELENLTTDTVEGNSPLKSSRVRLRTLLASKLPIKKRSLVESSLPLKKRSIIHSTPLKRKAKIDVLDLSRVSPIDPAGSANTSGVTKDRSRHIASTHNKSRQSKSRRSLLEITKAVSTAPKETHVALELNNERNKTTEVSASKSPRSTFVVPKKAKDDSPKRGKASRRAKQTKVEAETNKRKTRQDDKMTRNDEAAIVAIKVTRATRKTAKNEIVSETKVDTKTKSRQTRSGASKTSAKRAVAEKVAKTAVIDKKKVKVESEPAKEAGARGKKTAAVKSKDSKKEEKERKTRGRKTVEVKSTGSGKVEPKQRSTRGAKSGADVKEKEPSRKRRGETVAQPALAPKRAKVADVPSSPETNGRGRTRAAKKTVAPSSAPKRTRGAAKAVDSSPKSGKAASKAVETVKKRSKRGAAKVTPSPVAKRTRRVAKAVASPAVKAKRATKAKR